MPLVNGIVPNLINGVSQQPSTLRLSSQGDFQKTVIQVWSRV